jgi:hypothetical protein
MTLARTRRAAGILLTLGCAAAQSAGKLPHRSDVEAFVPIDEDTAWHYLQTSVLEGIPRPYQGILDRQVCGAYRDDNGKTWHVVRVARGERHPLYEHWQFTSDGLWQAPGTHTARTGAAIRILAAPVGAVTEWSNPVPRHLRLEGRDQQRGDDEDTEPDSRMVLRLESPATPIRVPAGTFLATHIVRIDTFADATRRTESWYAPGMGLVAEETFDGTKRTRTELQKFQPGRDRSAARENLVRMMLPPACVWSGAGPATIRWSDRAESMLFGGRFALIENGPTRHCAAVGPDYAVYIAPDVEADWQAMVRRAGPRLVPIDPEQLATLVAHLHAFRCRLLDVRSVPLPTSPLVEEAGTTAAVAELSGLQDGVRRRVAVLASCEQGVAIKIDTDTKPGK